MHQQTFFSHHWLVKRLAILAVLASVSACSLNASHTVASNTDQGMANNVVSQIVETNELAQAIQQAKVLPQESTLVVFDIDDTLLTAGEFFGSDKWYDWQRGRALNANGQVLNTADSDKVSCLFDILGMTYEIATNQPTQANMAELVSQVQQDVLILTARSDKYRAATHRELKRNELDFTEQALTPKSVGLHYPMTLDGRTANVSYVNGVFMVQGMNKGVMLLDLLKRLNKQYNAVVFVDDKTHNIENMANALKQANIDYYGFKYTRVDKSVSPQEVAHAQAAANDLTQLLNKHFIDRAKSIELGQCDY